MKVLQELLSVVVKEKLCNDAWWGSLSGVYLAQTDATSKLQQLSCDHHPTTCCNCNSRGRYSMPLLMRLKIRTCVYQLTDLLLQGVWEVSET